MSKAKEAEEEARLDTTLGVLYEQIKHHTQVIDSIYNTSCFIHNVGTKYVAINKLAVILAALQSVSKGD